MASEMEVLLIQKATMYDLLQIIRENPNKTYTAEELEKIITAYIAGAQQ